MGSAITSLNFCFHNFLSAGHRGAGRLRRPRPARSRGARPVGRSGTGTLLAAYCKRHTGAERRCVGGTASGSMYPPRETKHAGFSKVRPFRSCARGRPKLEDFRETLPPAKPRPKHEPSQTLAVSSFAATKSSVPAAFCPRPKKPARSFITKCSPNHGGLLAEGRDRSSSVRRATQASRLTTVV